MAEAPKLYLQIDGEEHGPITVEEVKEWVDEGRFTVDDYIRTDGNLHWVKAENVVHLKALFDERLQREALGAFESWIDAVRSGKPATQLSYTGVEAERARIQEELDRLEKRRKLIEEEERTLREADEEREEEFRRILNERNELEETRRRLESEEAEVRKMAASAKKTRRVPILIAAGVVILVLMAAVPAYYFVLYLPGKEAAEKADTLADKLAKLDELEQRIADLTDEYNDAIARGDEGRVEELKKEIDEALAEKEELVEDIGPSMDTTKGKTTLAGLLRAQGPGANTPTRSSGAVTSAIGGNIGGLRSTYSSELSANPDISGQVVVEFTVDTGGSVTNAHVVSSTVDNSAVESAAVAAVRRTRFGAADGETTLTYKFEFAPR
ncbi:MAG: TonB family protein [Candidatus Coatesbacteria bacterium]|nr:MAG: TonB family protein [Candidatus Coatesbacteria bacterium]